MKYYEKKLWIFLDEINISNCIGLICEMMTKHSCQGNPLPKNIVFIGACNPYRLMVKDEDPYVLEISGIKKRKLVYPVNPLPQSLLNFTFIFNLTNEDEKSYFKSKVIKAIESFYWKEVKEKKEEKKKEKENKDLKIFLSEEEFKQYNDLKNLASKSLIEAENYIRKKVDDSSASLREIRRFCIFYEFFVEYLRKKKII